MREYTDQIYGCIIVGQPFAKRSAVQTAAKIFILVE